MANRIIKSVSILPSVWEGAEQKAKEDDCSTSRVVERAIRHLLDGIESESPRGSTGRKRRRSTQHIQP